jgi:hypothetical protein
MKSSRSRPAFPYLYVWKKKFMRTLDRKGQRCRILSRGRMNSIQVEFQTDGFRAIVSSNALRRAKPNGCKNGH